MKYYSGNGDQGETYICNAKVSKTDKMVKAVGDVDELMANIGNVVNKIKYASVTDTLKTVEHDLYVLSGEISGYADAVKNGERLSEQNVAFLEEALKRFSEGLPDINNFVCPNGLPDATEINVCRAVARRAERSIIEAGVEDQVVLKYINRLSSLLFVMFRHLNKMDNFKEEFFKN